MRYLWLVSFCFYSMMSWGQAPKYSNEFLNIGIGASYMAMGNVGVSSADDLYAVYWNPAGLAKMNEDYQVALLHAEYFAGIAKYDFLGGAMKVDESSTLGLGIIRLGVDDIPNTLDLIDENGNVRYDRIKSFSVADYAFLFSYARKPRIENLRYGISAKIIHRRAGEFGGAWGFGIDAGMNYRFGKWMLGITGKDITTTFNAWHYNNEELEEDFLLTGNELPENSVEITLPRVILGISREIIISTRFSALVASDIYATFDGKRHVLVSGKPVSLDPHIGFQVDYKKIVFLRGGFSNFQKIPGFQGKESISVQPNLGLGMNLGNFSLNYALTDIGNLSVALYSNIFSIRYSFKKNK